MGFTNVAWESRSAEQLAGDLTAGPGPASVGQAGAAWVRVADELASIAEEYATTVEKFTGAFASDGADAAARKLDEFGQWLQAVSLSAAGNGQRAEDAAVAYSVAVLAMPSVAHVVETRAVHDVMASLAAYNGAILNGQFAEFDDAASAGRANASAVMYQYEDACTELAAPWDQPVSPDVSNGAALKAERQAKAESDAKALDAAGGAGHGGAGRGVTVPPPPLAPFRADAVKGGGEAKLVQVASTSGGAQGVGAPGGGYGPMAGLGRGNNAHKHESSVVAETLDGGGEPGAGLSGVGPSWLPATQQSDAPFLVSNVSWGPSTSVFDELAVPDDPAAAQYADAPAGTLEQVSRQWVSPPVLGMDKGLTL